MPGTFVPGSNNDPLINKWSMQNMISLSYSVCDFIISILRVTNVISIDPFLGFDNQCLMHWSTSWTVGFTSMILLMTCTVRWISFWQQNLASIFLLQYCLISHSFCNKLFNSHYTILIQYSMDQYILYHGGLSSIEMQWLYQLWLWFGQILAFVPPECVC